MRTRWAVLKVRSQKRASFEDLRIQLLKKRTVQPANRLFHIRLGHNNADRKRRRSVNDQSNLNALDRIENLTDHRGIAAKACANYRNDRAIRFSHRLAMARHRFDQIPSAMPKVA